MRSKIVIPVVVGSSPIGHPRIRADLHRSAIQKIARHRAGFFLLLGRPKAKSAPLGGSKPKAQRGGIF